MGPCVCLGCGYPIDCDETECWRCEAAAACARNQVAARLARTAPTQTEKEVIS